MRIADIVAGNAESGTVVVDMTTDGSGISQYVGAGPGTELQHRRVTQLSDIGQPRPKFAVVLQQLATDAVSDTRNTTVRIDVREAGERVVNILLSDRIEAFLERGLIEQATRSGWEIATTHTTEHRVFRFAVVMKPAAEGAEAPAANRLRAINEYRFTKQLVRVRDERIQTLESRIQKVEARLDRAAKAEREALRDFNRVTEELAALRAAHQRLARERDDATKSAAEHKARAFELERQLELTHKKMVTARTSLSFRLGRATKLALQKRSSNPLGIPSRWLQAFRERSAIPPGLEPMAARTVAPNVARAGNHDDARARHHWLLNLDTLTGQRPGVAGIANPRFAAELGKSARFRSLTPNAWRYQLEVEQPAYVLVTADGLEPGTAWGSFGTPNGRDATQLLHELTAFCNATGLPVIYWDTLGRNRPRLGAPRGVTFDAVFSVSDRCCEIARHVDGPAPTVLAPAVEPLVNRPLGVAAVPPHHPIYAGAFDRRLDARELSALEDLLRAAARHGLEILDSHWGYDGALAASLAFPDDLVARCKRRSPPDDEVRTVRSAGLLICGNTAARADFVPWELLRGVAVGAHVVATLAVDDPDLAAGVWVPDGPDHAGQLIATLCEQSRLGTSWRTAFERVLFHYNLRDRLNEIARVCGVSRVAPDSPRIAVLARLCSAADLRELREFLAAQDRPPDEVRILAGYDIDVGALAGAVPADRVFVAPAGSEAAAIRKPGASHFLLWHVGCPRSRRAVSALVALGQVSDAPIVALLPEPDEGATNTPGYQFGELCEGAIVAVHSELAPRLNTGALTDPVAAMRALAAEGVPIFAERSSPGTVIEAYDASEGVA